jgi:electron transfer flavoprotein alpha/beta subunit
MRILVCVKQVPDPTAPIHINESALWVTGDQSTPHQMNRFDEYAVEQALILKEQIPDTSVHVVTAGPEGSAAVVRRALGMGADHGIHVLTCDEGYVSPFLTASRIAASVRERKCDVTLHQERDNTAESRWGRHGGSAAPQPSCRRKIQDTPMANEATVVPKATRVMGFLSSSTTPLPLHIHRAQSRLKPGERSRYDLILAGVMSEDMCQGLVGPMLAEMLSMPCATSCISVRVQPQRSSVYVEREIEGGRRQLLELDLPALLTVQSGLNKPRYPSLSNIMRAGRQELAIMPDAADASSQPQEALLRLTYPRKTRAGVFLEGSRKDKARQLLTILRERSLLP